VVPRHQPKEARFDLGIRRFRKPVLGVQDKIVSRQFQGDRPQDLSQNRAQTTLAAISQDSVAHLARDGDPDAMFLALGSENESGEVRCMKPLPLIVDPTELPTISQFL